MMYKIKIQDNTNLSEVELKPAIQKSMQQAAIIIQNAWKRNAPYLTGTLRRSITTASIISWNWIKVWSNLIYAPIREKRNSKNPSTIWYMKRAVTENETRIKDLFHKNLKWAM